MRFQKLTRSEAIGLARQKGAALGFVASIPFTLLFWKLTGSVTKLPLYSLAAIGAVIGGLLAGRRAANRYDQTQRFGHHLCTKCGYDLRGNESGVCPECGLPIPLGPLPDLTRRVRVYDGELDLKATIVFGAFTVVGIVLMLASPRTFGLGLLMTFMFGVVSVLGVWLRVVGK